ncbi:zinc-ribbon domain-containing protein [Arenibacterium sp. CAU 1754]
MRISCPNCGAQYEVPTEVIPSEGRDVQCSNCGDTWFQAHPDNIPDTPMPTRSAPQDDVETSPADTEDHDDHLSDPMPEPEPEPEPEPDYEPEPEPEYEPEEDYTPEPEDIPEPEEQPEGLVQRELDPSVADILREEAEHEARLRAGEVGGLESQGDLGLDEAAGDEAARRSREAQERMARMRGEAADTAEPEALPESRGGLLPDIEEINSTLRAEGEASVAQNAMSMGAEEIEPRGGGFSRGFGLIILLTVILILIYMNAATIIEMVPALEPVISSYVAMIDQGRVWLESKISGFIPK